MQFAEREICELTESIWRSVLGLDLKRSERAVTPNRGDRFLTGCVQITGAWEGAVTVDCTASLARRIAGIMFRVDPDHAEDAEVQDALGELANMTGGNIKNILPAPSLISIPAVTEGSDYSVTFPGGRLLSQIAFDCQGEPLLITLLQRSDQHSSMDGPRRGGRRS
jgi:chemotaxis protein CheX